MHREEADYANMARAMFSHPLNCTNKRGLPEVRILPPWQRDIFSNIIYKSPKSDGCALELRGRGKGVQMVADPRHLQEPSLVTLHLKNCG